mmetsp:Transcript_43689/g.115518  ORF Transcript_43689/g.115518 Transcript_43689/m.115518 type:complete len:232 (+) Transcript_43689:137-832(+)
MFRLLRVARDALSIKFGACRHGLAASRARRSEAVLQPHLYLRVRAALLDPLVVGVAVDAALALLVGVVGRFAPAGSRPHVHEAVVASRRHHAEVAAEDELARVQAVDLRVGRDLVDDVGAQVELHRPPRRTVLGAFAPAGGRPLVGEAAPQPSLGPAHAHACQQGSRRHGGSIVSVVGRNRRAVLAVAVASHSADEAGDAREHRARGGRRRVLRARWGRVRPDVRVSIGLS